MSAWTDSKIQILRENWGTMTASALAEKIGGVSRNAVIGKAHRLKLSSKIIKRPKANSSINSNFDQKNNFQKRTRKVKFRSLLLDKNFEPAKNLSLEELTENTCKYMEGHPDESTASFCGRKNVEKFSYCPLHLIVVYVEKGKKEDLTGEDEIPHFIEKKIKSA
tara:strand:- start:522 stop:1013 length:492 start_codon:yes stop_codon:yes gene_type:complete